MNVNAMNLSSSSRLAKASERLNILTNELHIALVEGSGTGLDPDMLSWLSTRLSSQALDLAEIALAVAEDAVAISGDPRAERSAAALGRVARIIEPVFAVASELAAHLVLHAEKAARSERSLTTADLSGLDAPITQLLVENKHLITGAGVATAPHELADAELWMQWWVQGPSGLVQLVPELERGGSQFYDYPSAVWFSGSARDLAPHLAPPHFDDGGTDTWMVTATIPVIVRDRFIGLACAELTLERIGSLVAPALRAIPAPAVLVSPERLVVASTHPDMRPGASARLGDYEQSGHDAASFAELSPGLTVARSPALAWRVVVDWTLAPQ
jgi:hypothetical protein